MTIIGICGKSKFHSLKYIIDSGFTFVDMVPDDIEHNIKKGITNIVVRVKTIKELILLQMVYNGVTLKIGETNCLYDDFYNRHQYHKLDKLGHITTELKYDYFICDTSINKRKFASIMYNILQELL